MKPVDELGRVLSVAPHLRLLRHAAQGVTFLLGERSRFVVGGGDALTVIDRVDGVRTVEQIVEACSELPPVRVLQILLDFERRGLLAGVRRGAPERLAFESGLSASFAPPPVALVDATGSTGGALRAVADALHAAGLAVFPARADAAEGPQVIVAADYLAPACAERAGAAWRAGRPCFLVQPGGLRAFIGPYFSAAPGEPCPACFLDALREQRPVERLLQRAAPERAWPAPPRAELPASLAAAGNLAAIRLRSILAAPDPAARSARLWALDFARMELTEHPVRRRPQCPACGDPTLQAKLGERPVTLSSAVIAFDADGGCRREPPAESYARLRHLVSPLLGPVSHLHPMPGRHAEEHPVWSSGYLVSPRRAASANVFDRNCAGKGATSEQARMSALAEAIERASGVHRGDEAVRHASLRELDGDAIPPAAVQLFSAAQVDAPPALPPAERIAWTPAWSIRDDRRHWVPLAYCYSEAPDNLGATYCRSSSNGSAAGNCLEEAILQGLYEAVERDATAIWWYGRIRRPPARVPLAGAAWFDAQRASFAARGVSLWALDLTHDIGLPVVVALAVHEPSDRLAMGFGCHHDPVLALRRAVSELHQVFDPEATVRGPWDGISAATLDFLRPDPDAPRAPPAAPIASRDLRDHVETWARRLGELGLDTVVVDKTRPDMGMRVAQVIVPGLRHAWPRFAAGRLYEVPVALGWVSSAHAEQELNPHPLLI